MSSINGISKNYNPKRFPWQTAPVIPIANRYLPTPPRSSGEKWNKSMHRFPCKPWHKCDKPLKTHAQKRAERAVARWKAA